MDSFDFRCKMIEKIRAFENWAWKDAMENPDEYQNMDFDAWTTLFNTYMEDQDA